MIINIMSHQNQEELNSQDVEDKQASMYFLFFSGASLLAPLYPHRRFSF